MSSRFEIHDTPLQGLKCVRRKPIRDDRGYFERMYCAEELRPLLTGRTIVQINHTLTNKRGAVRGLHFQRPPHSETKIVNCLRGEVFDVAVDVRENSPTFLRWHSEILSADNHKSLLIPEGFAHGFQSLTEDCELLYFHTAAWQSESEVGLNVQDEALDIRWPLAIAELSPRDAAHPRLSEEFTGISI